MTLNEFMNMTTAKLHADEWRIEIPLKDGTTGRLFVKYAESEFDAKERAFLYLQEIIYNKNNKGSV